MKRIDTIGDWNDEAILAWAEEQDWAVDMAACQQDAAWHAEGDVWTHTKWVCEELVKLDAWDTRTREDQVVLMLTALLHDAGKPATTALDPDTGRLRSHRHSIVGQTMARKILSELGVPRDLREHVANLVRFHGRPVFVMEKRQPAEEVIGLSGFLNNHLLHLFTLADFRGREAKEASRSEDELMMWKLLAEEHACLDQPYAFANDHARFLFYRQKLSSLHFEPHEEFRCRAVLMSGLPGAGKDTWLSQHPDLPVVSLDQIRKELKVSPTGEQGQVLQLARERCKEHMRAGRDFALNATNTTRQMRNRWINIFADYQARVEIVSIEAPLPVILKQNRSRKHPVPDRVIQRLCDSWEPPHLSECHALSVVET